MSLTETKKTTRITRMEMRGFKSFANKTVIPFQESFNCILGPNGSGKSNVLDSLCFVLGKSGAKSLRAEKSANLIYNGGKSKKPAKQGEVHIYFDNTSRIFPLDTDEIKISRVVKQNGTSKYLINDEVVTRQQVVDLLSHARINPDGYNIILQGDIVRLVEMSPVERRGIIEEISGISIYEDKKAKAQRELDRVEEQLREADIVLAERRVYLDELKKERDQALKFKELDEKIKRNKKTILVRRLKDKQNKLAELDKQIKLKESQVLSVQSEIDSLKENIIDKKRQLDELQREVELKGEKEQVALMREVESLKVDVAVKEQRLTQLVSELERISDRRRDLEASKLAATKKIEQLKKEISAGEKRIASRTNDLERIEQKIIAFQKKHDLSSAADIDQRINELDLEAERLQEEIRLLREKQQQLLREQDKIEFQIQTIDQKVAKVLEAKNKNKNKLELLKQKQAQLSAVQKELSKALDRSSALVPEIQTAKGKLATKEEQYSKLKARQNQLIERAASSRAVAEILKLRSKNKKIYGTVAELGKVEKEYALALEIAAGGRINSIVVEDDQTAQDCIRYLKNNQLGVATFLPLNKLRARTIPVELRNLPHTLGLAVDHVTYDKKFQVVFYYVLGSTIVVKDVAAARKVGVGKARMVTLEGDLIEATGAMTGGFRARKSTGMGFQEKELSADLSRLEEQIADLNTIISRLLSEQEELSSRIDELRKKRHELETESLSLERELHIDSSDIDASKQDKTRLQQQAKQLENDISAVLSEVSRLNKQLASIKMEKSSLRDKIMKLRSPQAIAELNAFQQQKQVISEEITKIKVNLDNLRNQISNIYEPEIENINKILSQQEKEKNTFETEQKELKNLLQQLKSSLKEKQKQEQAFREQFKSLFDKRSKLESEKDKLESTILSKEEKIRDLENKLNTLRVQAAGFKAEIAGLEEELKDYEGVDPYKTKSQDDILSEIKEFEKLVANMGAVNMKALEIYDRVEQEFKSLMDKKNVLSKEREDVLLMINEIDSKKRELFMVTYDKIQAHFKDIFQKLSWKGEAFLELENPADPLSGGLDIRVRIKGNKFMDIRSLSGGEKTMTALAFLFAVQEYEPACFYVLDEVDAALDKKNSERLGKLISSYSKRAQYIIISHNDTIISEADTLFGVSMNEHGESQVTSLQI